MSQRNTFRFSGRPRSVKNSSDVINFWIKFLKDDITQIKPVVMATVPRLWEAIHDGFFQALKKMPSKKQKLIKFLVNNSSVKGDLAEVKQQRRIKKKAEIYNQFRR